MRFLNFIWSLLRKLFWRSFSFSCIMEEDEITVLEGTSGCPEMAPSNKEAVREEIEDIDVMLDSVGTELIRLQRRKSELLSRRKRLQEQLRELDFKQVRETNWSSKCKMQVFSHRCAPPHILLPLFLHVSVNVAAFEWSQRMDSILHDTFKLQRYRPNQIEAMNAFLSGHNVMLTMPTGGGKSLCYQLPALAHHKQNSFTLVVSPLVSLIEDQVMALEKLNINATTLNASCSREKVNNVHKVLTLVSSLLSCDFDYHLQYLLMDPISV